MYCASLTCRKTSPTVTGIPSPSRRCHLSGDDYAEVFGPRSESFAERLGKPVPPEAKEATAGSSVYKPYGFMPNGISESCDIQRWIEGTEKPTGVEVLYKFLMKIGY